MAEKTALRDVVQIVYIDGGNALFKMANDFLTLTLTLPDDGTRPEEVKAEDKPDDKKPESKNDKNNKDGKKDDKPAPPPKPAVVMEYKDGKKISKYERVFLHRAFPFESPYEYISVLDRDGKEIGLIKDVKGLGEDAEKLIVAELERKYYTPTVRKIISMRERFGFSYWKVESDTGERSFTMQDTYRNIHKVTPTHIFLTDVDGNRYDIPDLEELDRKSYRRIELYL